MKALAALALILGRASREPPAARGDEAEAAQWEAERDRGGWRSWMHDPPQAADFSVQMLRQGWDMPGRADRLEDVPAATNVYGLFWRPAGPLRDVTPGVEFLNHGQPGVRLRKVVEG